MKTFKSEIDVKNDVIFIKAWKRPKKKCLKFKNPLAYYTCYSIFLGFVGLFFIISFLLYHLLCCAVHERDKMYECFMRLNEITS